MSTPRFLLASALVLLGTVAVRAQSTVDDLSGFQIRDRVPRGSVRAILNGLGGQSYRVKVPAAFARIETAGMTVTPAPPAQSPVSCGEADAPMCDGFCSDPRNVCVFLLRGCECVDAPR